MAPDLAQLIMERWEYQVIHLNVEVPVAAPAPSAPPQAPPPEPPPRPEAVFSKEYLAKEFPGFYGAQPAPGEPAKEHPAHQLRRFLNLQGQEGWQLLGFYPVGQLTMIVFRRPLPVAPAEGGGDRLPVAPAASAADQGARGSLQLEPLLARLDALERRLGATERPARGAAPDLAADVLEPDGSAGLQDGRILPSDRCRALDGQPRLGTAEAARALGFRSAASLLNLASRSGYRLGLIKRGANGAVAVYVGREKNERGGRDRRLWVVIAGGSL